MKVIHKPDQPAVEPSKILSARRDGSDLWLTAREPALARRAITLSSRHFPNVIARKKAG